MPNIPYTPIENGQEGNDSLWNTRFLALHDALNGGLDATNLADNAVTASKLATDSVTTGKIADKAVTSAKLADPEAWSNITFQGGWANHDLTNFPRAGYMKDTTGTVYLRGLINSGTIGAVMTTLPAGYRPTLDLHIATVSNAAFGNVRINRDGTVIPQVGSNAWFALDGISFRVGQ